MPDASPPAENDQPKQPFIPPADRPAVGVNPDTPLSELRVRDLAAILGPAPVKPVLPEILVSPTTTVGKGAAQWKAEIEALLQGAVAFPPGGPPGPDPRISQAIEAVVTLTTTVERLADQVAQLRGPAQGETQG
jgi:hypothetical protein